MLVSPGEEVGYAISETLHLFPRTNWLHGRPPEALCVSSFQLGLLPFWDNKKKEVLRREGGLCWNSPWI